MSPVQSLKESGLKATLPRRKILELFEASKVRHLSAEDVYKALIAEGIDVGLATVYRVLTQFEQAGLLSRQHFETGKAGFGLNQGELLDARDAIEALHPHLEARRLRHRPLRIAARGDLRQMRHAQHLALPAQALERSSDRFGDGAADPRIHLVEDERRHGRGLCRHQ